MLEGMLEEILAGKKRVERCTVGRWLDALAEDDRGRAEAILAHPEVNAEEIVLHLGASIGTSAHTVRRHRRGACVCFR